MGATFTEADRVEIVTDRIIGRIHSRSQTGLGNSSSLQTTKRNSADEVLITKSRIIRSIGLKTRLLLVVVDAVLVGMNLSLALSMRVSVENPVPHLRSFRDTFILLTVIHLLFLMFSRALKKRFRSYWDLFIRILAGLLLSSVVGVGFLYVFRMHWNAFPSSVFVIALPLSLLSLYGFHAMVYTIVGAVGRKVVVVGSDPNREMIWDRRTTEKISVRNLADLAGHQDIDEVVLCERLHDESTLNLLIYLFQQLKTRIYFSPDLYAQLLSDSLNGNGTARFLTTFVGRKSDMQEFMIRFLDIIGSIIMLVISSPIWPIAAVWIKVTSKGPVFYKQDRVGKDGIVFQLYKFRTMYDNKDRNIGLLPTLEDDPRVTPIGRWLRKTRLDELPQLINVFKGQMSLVGPRPENLWRIEKHRILQGIRLAVKPGITGLAQIRSFYDVHPRHKIRYDYLYIQRRSVQLNLYILFQTIPVMFSCSGR
ncbi:MAG: sugar transferase [Sedimentisphaerales bacterium]|nr:sugar transferase [Sedimentisphaerales bacterium]